MILCICQENRSSLATIMAQNIMLVLCSLNVKIRITLQTMFKIYLLFNSWGHYVCFTNDDNVSSRVQQQTHLEASPSLMTDRQRSRWCPSEQLPSLPLMTSEQCLHLAAFKRQAVFFVVLLSGRSLMGLISHWSKRLFVFMSSFPLPISVFVSVQDPTTFLTC